MYSIGIDAGSKTIKLVVIDEKDNVVHYIYKKHSSNIQETLDAVIKEFISRYGDFRGYAAITGSAGIGIAEMLGLPFVQEVVATTEAVKSAYPAANAFVELGGEDSKVVYLDSPIEQRMNTTCAGGTGGFIDSVAALLGIKTSEMEMYARRAEHVYPIAYRCAVYAQTDIRPLINSGASKEDIAASALEAVVKQTVSGLACGRPIRGKVIFLGGPLEYIPQLVQRFRLALGLNEKSGIKPHRANIFTARGAAIDAREPASPRFENEGSNVVSLSQLLEMLRKKQVVRNDLGCFPPLFMDAGESETFSKHHAANAARHIAISQADGPLYLGIDVGSATIKQVLIDDDGNILDSDCRRVRGDIVNTAIVMLRDLYSNLPKNGTYIKRALTTGQSDEIVKSALMADASVVDVIAHVRAALSFEPEAEMVIDAGGQDVKIARISDGKISDTILNEPCSSGLGSFFDETARTFGYDIDTFSEKALNALAPVELDTKCTVFMTSRVRHAQKIGAGADNISAGIAYSIAQSILYRVLGHLGATALKGKKVILQGGVFLSDAVVRAFETISECEAVRPEEAQYMGALGASLIAREQVHDRADEPPAEEGLPSTLAKPDLLKMLDPVYSAYGCKGCEEKCMLSLVDYGDERVFVSGNRCERVALILQEEYSKIEKGEHLGTVSLLPRSEHSKRSGAKDSELGGGIVIPGYLRSFSGGMVGGGGGVGGEWLKQGNVSGHWLRESFGGGKYSRRKSSGETYHREWTRHWGEDEKEVRLDNARCGVTIEMSRKSVEDIDNETPNVIRREQELLSAYATTDGKGARRNISIGIVNTLLGYETLPFWHTLFVNLGYSVFVSDEKLAKHARIRSAESIPSESVCGPAKITHARVYDMILRGVDAICMPKLKRDSGCPIACKYSDAIADNVPMIASGDVRAISPTLASADTTLFEEDHSAKQELLNSLAELSDDAPSMADLERALKAASSAQANFVSEMEKGVEQTLRWINADEDHYGAVIACRPYHVDHELVHDIDRNLVRLGIAPLSFLGLNSSIFENSHERLAHKKGSSLLDQSMELVNDNPKIGLVIIHSFNCGFETVDIDNARRTLIDLRRPFTVLRLDEIADPVHIATQLKTFAVSLMGREEGQTSCEEAQGVSAASMTAKVGKKEVGLLDGGINREDLETAKTEMPSDMCFTASAIASHAINVLKADPDIEKLRIPKVCENCLIEELPDLLSHRFPRVPRIIYDSRWGGGETDASSLLTKTEQASVRIGIIGNPLLCYDSFMNDHLIDLLLRLGAQPVLPNPELIAIDDVRYLDQLKAFAENGVDSVLYLQSFGCLKGHVYARGALHEMARNYPDMPVTVIDYDPESSRLNRENRIRLVVSAAKIKARGAVRSELPAER